MEENKRLTKEELLTMQKDMQDQIDTINAKEELNGEDYLTLLGLELNLDIVRDLIRLTD